jgi:hypothetical protein
MRRPLPRVTSTVPAQAMLSRRLHSRPILHLDHDPDMARRRVWTALKRKWSVSANRARIDRALPGQRSASDRTVPAVPE